MTNLLIERINNYAVNKKFDFVVSANKLTNFTLNENRAKCLMKCFFCEVNVACLFNNNCWHISNYTKHIHDHLKKNHQRIEIQRGNQFVLSEVESVLGANSTNASRSVIIFKYICNHLTFFQINANLFLKTH